MAMAELTNDIIQKIYEIYVAKGYVSENTIFNFIIDAGIALDETDRVIDRLLSMGVLIQDEPVATQTSYTEDDEDDFDRTQLDYEEIYTRVLKIDSSLSYIIDYVRQVQPPRTHETSNLMVQAKSGDDYARNRLIEMLMKIAIKMALNFTEKYHTDLGDTIQYAFEGLIIAYEKFEIGRQDNFTTYAPWWIRQNLHRTIDVCYGLHTPVHYDERLMAILDIYNEHYCYSCNKYDICPEFIRIVCDKLEISEKQAKQCLSYMQEPICIDELVKTEDTSLLSWTNDEITNEVAYCLMKDQMQDVLYTLTPRESNVIKMRFGLNDGYEKSLEEVGKEFGVTRERIRQIEAKALRKLRHPSRSKKLKDYLD